MDMVGYKINQSVRTRSGETTVNSLNSELFSSNTHTSSPGYFNKMPKAYQNAMKELPDGYVDTKYVAPFLPDTQALVNSSDSKAGEKIKKAAATALFLAMAACNSKPKDMVNISSAISACQYPNGASLQGNIEYVGFGSASFGQRMELGKIEKGTSKTVTAKLTSNGYLPSTSFRSVTK